MSGAILLVIKLGQDIMPLTQARITS